MVQYLGLHSQQKLSGHKERRIWSYEAPLDQVPLSSQILPSLTGTNPMAESSFLQCLMP